MHKQNLFFIGLDDSRLQQLEQLPQAEHCAFHPLLEVHAIHDPLHCDMRALIHEAVDTLAGFKGTVDGIASDWGFPASALVPILAARFRLPSPPLEAVLRCEHCYWGRREQAEAVPEHVPSFQAFNPRDDDLPERLALEPPYWIHPFESFRSDLVFPVHRPEQLDAALPLIRRQEALLSEPFQWILTNFEVPADIRQMRETFLAEPMIAGERCTVEGYIHEGEVHGHILGGGLGNSDPFSLCRSDEANPLRREVESRVLAIAEVVLTRIGLDNALFSLDFFYNQDNDHIWLLGINPVISRAGSERFEQAQGISPLGVMVDLALGRKPVAIQQDTKPSIATAEPRAEDPADGEPETATRVEADE
ncbi:ATP-grasp domain-containing protein [Halochromatium sp.]